jgi:hypothetical protein
MKRVAPQIPHARKIVAGLSESELRALLLERLYADPELESILLSRHAKGKGLKTMERLFDLALAKAGEPDDHGFWDEAFYYDFMVDLEKIEKTAKKALTEGDHERGLRIYFMLIERVAPMSNEGDDHDGSLMSGVNEWMETLDGYARRRNASAERLKLLRDWARAAESASWAKGGDSWDESCREILIHSARGKKELRAELERAVALADSSGQDRHDEYRSKQAAIDAIDLYARLKDIPSRYAFIDSHLRFPDVRTIAIDEAAKAKDWVKAEILAREGMRQADAESFHGIAERFAERLWEILCNTGNAEAAAVFELERFLSTESDDWYKRLKKRHHATWIEYRENLFAKTIAAGFNPETLASLYDAERLYDRLLALCQQKPILFGEYYPRLGNAYPVETAVWLKGWIEKNCRQTQSRSSYRDIGKRIREYSRYAGDEAARALVDALLIRYSNRPAMRQEFTNALKPQARNRTLRS